MNAGLDLPEEGLSLQRLSKIERWNEIQARRIL